MHLHAGAEGGFMERGALAALGCTGGCARGGAIAPRGGGGGFEFVLEMVFGL